MARVVDLTGENVTRQRRKERNYGTKTDLASTVVERGSTHWAEGSNVHIDGLLGVAGTATVSGTLSVTGTLNASGSINLSGSTAITGPLNVTGTTTIGGNTNITGELNVTGPTTLDGVTDIGGDTTITGLLDVEGRTTIAADLELLTGGKLIAGQTTIEPTGKATFGSFVIDPSSNRLIDSPGGWLFSTGPDTLGLSSSLTSSVNLNGTFAELNYGGTSTSVVRASNGRIELTATKTWVNGLFEVSGATKLVGRLTADEQVYIPNISNASSSSFTPNVYIDSNGKLWRTPWTPA